MSWKTKPCDPSLAIVSPPFALWTRKFPRDCSIYIYTKHWEFTSSRSLNPSVSSINWKSPWGLNSFWVSFLVLSKSKQNHGFPFAWCCSNEENSCTVFACSKQFSCKQTQIFHFCWLIGRFIHLSFNGAL